MDDESDKQDQITLTFEAINDLELAKSKDVERPYKQLFQFYKKYIKSPLLFIWIIFTGFLTAAFVLQTPKGYSQDLLVLGLLYTFTTIRLIFVYVPAMLITKPCNAFINQTSDFFCRRVSSQIWTYVWALFSLSFITISVFALKETEESPRIRRLISFSGYFIILGLVFLSSKSRRYIPWNTVITGVFLQFILALIVFHTVVGASVFQWVSNLVNNFLAYSNVGAAFIFGDSVMELHMVALLIVAPLVFFAAVVQALFYIGIIQYCITKVSKVCSFFLKVTGPEAIVAIASPFLGASENCLLIRPLVKDCTKSEIHQIMTCGFATISGSSLYLYIVMGISGKALLTSCIMSIPCSIVVSKLRFPESEESSMGETIIIPKMENEANNMLHAIGQGSSTGLHISFLIISTIIAVVSIIAAVNGVLNWFGKFLNTQGLSVEDITGYCLIPFVWLVGVDDKDLVIAGRLMATKIWITEFVAYGDLTTTYKDQISARSYHIITYIICGFANLSYMGTLIGIIGSFAPSRSGEVASLAISAFICGTTSTLLSAAVAGMLN
ncbi:Na+ dependent nucleoside transporter C-terminus-domain-containing protein [Sporodiniella umbellata]|nr:Na+ dependent nucleoside transporter C-terminus-domain-containing protein [Sporodiniella umbellata]